MYTLAVLLLAVGLGVNLHALVALGAVLTGLAPAAIQRRTWASRCVASAVGFIASTLVICAVKIAYSLSSAGIEAPDDIPMGISEALNCLAFSVVGSLFPLLAALALTLLARRAARSGIRATR